MRNKIYLAVTFTLNKAGPLLDVNIGWLFHEDVEGTPDDNIEPLKGGE